MAAYKSAASGNWNVESTWGTTWQASTTYAAGDFVVPTTLNGFTYECTTGGTSGTTEPIWPTTIGQTVTDGSVVWTCQAGYPQTDGDTVTINTGHTVTYNVDDTTTQLGTVTIYGLLEFDDTGARGIRFGNNTGFSIQNGGELRIGTSAAPFTNNCVILHDTLTADNGQDIIVIVDGGRLTIYGDPAYLGGVDETTLADNPENTNNDNVIVTVDDMSTAWNSGDRIAIHKGGTYSDYKTDVTFTRITGISATTITCEDNVPASAAGALVINLSRNVKLRGGTYRPEIYDANSFGNFNCILRNVELDSIYWIRSSYNFRLLDSACFNGQNVLRKGRKHKASGKFGKFSYAFQGKGFQISGDIFASYIALCSVSSSNFSGRLFANYYGISGGANNLASGDFFSMRCAVYLGRSHVEHARLGYFGALSFPNTYDIFFDDSVYLVFRDVKIPAAGLVFAKRATYGFAGAAFFEDFDQVKGAHRVYDIHGDLIRNTAAADRPGGGSAVIEVVPLSSCNEYNPLWFFKVPEYPGIPLYFTAGAHSITVHIKSSGWTTLPAADELYVEVLYYDAATGGSRASAVSTATLTANDTWTAFPVSFTSAQDGHVYLRGVLKKYESGAKIYVDELFDTS